MEIKEFIGKKILNLFIEYCIAGKPDCTVERIYLDLEDAGIVTIPDIDSSSSETVIRKNGFTLHKDNSQVFGSVVNDVLVSEMLPFYNLLLSNGTLIFCDSPTPDRFNWYVDRYSEKYKNRYEYKSLSEL
jgi:hypothetical protein